MQRPCSHETSRSAKPKPSTRFDLVRQGLRAFLHTKSKLSARHEFALATLAENAAWVRVCAAWLCCRCTYLCAAWCLLCLVFCASVVYVCVSQELTPSSQAHDWTNDVESILKKVNGVAVVSPASKFNLSSVFDLAYDARTYARTCNHSHIRYRHSYAPTQHTHTPT